MCATIDQANVARKLKKTREKQEALAISKSVALDKGAERRSVLGAYFSNETAQPVFVADCVLRCLALVSLDAGMSRESALVAEIREMMSQFHALGRELRFETILERITVSSSFDTIHIQSWKLMSRRLNPPGKT